jgi:lipopolysaccharide transport system ATP-binding protein
MPGSRKHARGLLMSSDDFAIRVQGLSKHYQIYDAPKDRLKQMLVPRLQQMIGKQSKQYFREFKALNNVSFELKKGETVGIIGRNGSGKSTLLQMICGTLTPTKGSIETNGRIAALLELGSGFNPEFTGRENVYMNAAVHGLSKEEVDARFDDIVAFADIGDFIGQPVKTYSSGMMVRLAFSVIAHVDADILVVDEALAVGDAFFTQKCMRFLRDFMEIGTVLFVSHDTSAIINLCGKAILLNHGQIAKSGAPKEVAEHYLASLYNSTQAADELNTAESQEGRSDEYHDMRKDLINASSLRNDIEVFKFEPNKEGFGSGDGKIISVRLLDPKGVPLSWVIGGEDVVLEILSRAIAHIENPIVGFQVKDRLGQVVFADNTYLTYQFNPLFVNEGVNLVTKFEFRLPVLPSGDYSISCAVGSGTQEVHVQHHWVHDAMIFRAHASSVCHGLVGVPMRKIEIKIEGKEK